MGLFRADIMAANQPEPYRVCMQCCFVLGACLTKYVVLLLQVVYMRSLVKGTEVPMTELSRLCQLEVISKVNTQQPSGSCAQQNSSSSRQIYTEMAYT